jgi:hypothetical protein
MLWQTMWYSGVIARVRDGGACDVRFDDDDFESGVPPWFIRPTRHRREVRSTRRGQRLSLLQTGSFPSSLNVAMHRLA